MLPKRTFKKDGAYSLPKVSGGKKIQGADPASVPVQLVPFAILLEI